MRLDDYAYLWRNKDAGWALVRVDSVPGDPRPRYVIENTRTHQALVIEDDELYAAVKQEMFRQGVRVVGRDEMRRDPPTR